MIIPVLNRKKTISEAIQSALAQKTNFDFNIIVVDNHSTDGTTDILKKFAAKYQKLNISFLNAMISALAAAGMKLFILLTADAMPSSLIPTIFTAQSQTLQKIVDTLRKG